jgi:hypothetical protein
VTDALPPSKLDAIEAAASKVASYASLPFWNKQRRDAEDELSELCTSATAQALVARARRCAELEAKAASLAAHLKTLPREALGLDPDLGYSYRDQAISELEPSTELMDECDA